MIESSTMPTRRPRTATDAASGLALNRSDFPGYSDAALMGHFATFTQYDLDSTGFISPENLLEVLQAMDVEGASTSMVKLIIEEVAILTGHDNDGKLSFRDYMQCVVFDHAAAAHNLAIDAEAELQVEEAEEEESLRASMRSEEGDALDVSDETAPTSASRARRASDGVAQPSRMRQSSMAMVNAVASARIKAFQAAADAATAQSKLDAFRVRGGQLTGPMVNQEDMHKQTLRNKVQAFETAARFKGTIELKKTWREVGGRGNYQQGTKVLVLEKPTGLPPKKKLSDLP